MKKFFAALFFLSVIFGSRVFAQRTDPLFGTPASSPLVQPYFNLDFEREGTLKPWQIMLTGYNYDLEQENFSHGKQALKISFPYSDDRYDPRNGGTAYQIIPIGVVGVAKWKLDVSIDIKCEAITRGAMNFFAAVQHDSTSGIEHKSLIADTIRGTAPWKTYTLSFDCDTNVKFLQLACMLGGTGKAYFDNIQIKVNGQSLPQSPLPILPSVTKAEMALVASKLIPFDVNGTTSDPNLVKLDPFIDAHRVIGLGEATYGTHEFEQSKSRLIRYLVEKKGFTLFGIEANTAEMDYINSYLAGGSGNIDSLLKPMYYWCWTTQEIRDQLEWIRSYNLAGHHVRFFGFDMQVPYKATEEVTNFSNAAHLPHGADCISLVQKFGNLLERLETGRSGARDSFTVITGALYESLRNDESNVSSADKPKYKRILMYANNLREFSSLVLSRQRGDEVRDSSMAENIAAELATDPTAKCALWSHNLHIGKGNMNMGYFLEKKLGESYGAVGFAFDRGTFNASVDETPVACTAVPSYTGTFENFCKLFSASPFFLDLRGKAESSGLPKCFYSELEHRNVGLSFFKFSFWDNYVTSLYDAIIYIPESTPTKLLPIR
ncbi:MAG TPA: erythromycin esterase family protein [Candidatus Kapabacteria bacterium]|nr:erythromycin esterase family protein [Candidatus Kapabacteria bacterium]